MNKSVSYFFDCSPVKPIMYSPTDTPFPTSTCKTSVSTQHMTDKHIHPAYVNPSPNPKPNKPNTYEMSNSLVFWTNDVLKELKKKEMWGLALRLRRFLNLIKHKRRNHRGITDREGWQVMVRRVRKGVEER